MTVTWKEEGSRGLALVAMGDFPTAADAFFEIIDNPIDYRYGRHLEIDVTVDRESGLIVIEDRGGEGMDQDGIADWLKWGDGHSHAATDIGKFHKGGKAACGYLADSVEILTRRAGQGETWRFVDADWKTHLDWADYGDPEPYVGPIPDKLRAVPIEVGFTRIELTRLVPKRYPIDRLKLMLGNTYRRLIMDGDLVLTVNGEPIEPMALPLSTAFEKRMFDFQTPSGLRVRGWVGRLDRDAVHNPLFRIPGGMRLLFQRRLIQEGEWFGHRAEGKGLLASLIGEVEVNQLDPLSNKTGFKKDNAAWDDTEQAMNQWLAPIIAEFRRAADEQPVTREERKRANAVRRQLQEALRSLGATKDQKGQSESDRGRKRPSRRDRARHQQAKDEPATSREPRMPKTIPPEDAVGTLRRLRRRLGSGQEVPPIELVNADPSVRSATERRGDGQITKIEINRMFPLYAHLSGNESYLAETALLELLQPDAAEQMHPKAFIDQVNDCLSLWHRVATSPSAEEAA